MALCRSTTEGLDILIGRRSGGIFPIVIHLTGQAQTLGYTPARH
jgi:hypothetical protein